VADVVEGVHIDEAMPVAKVTFVSDDGLFVRAQARNNSFFDITSTIPTEREVGDIIFVDLERHQIEPAPSGLWPQALWVGVVRLVGDDVTVVSDAAGHLRRLAPSSDLQYERANTVECDDDRVVRVLSKRPISPFDLRDEGAVDLSLFKPPVEPGLSFEHFGGMRDVVDRARELVQVPLKYREQLREIGARPIKGVLFTGPPGTGKTMLASAIAQEAQAEFYAVSGPTIFSKWYGESQSVLRAIFDDAAAQEASIIFFDEIDSVAPKRQSDAHEESQRVVAQLLTLMDGYRKSANVLVIAATNRKDAIDDALRRPGRFDWEIEFRLPDAADRLAILERSGDDINKISELPLDYIAAQAEGWSGAELAVIWSEAALLAVVDGRRGICGEDLLGGFERVAAQRRRVQSPPSAREQP
jgi:ATP-dependent 26S proteasome regulatory subunit